jgi:hypothetical protein
MFGNAGGVQVWAAHGHQAILATVLVADGPPIVLLNQAIVNTPSEMRALCWAFEQIARGAAGFFVHLV